MAAWTGRLESLSVTGGATFDFDAAGWVRKDCSNISSVDWRSSSITTSFVGAATSVAERGPTQYFS